MFWWRRKRNVPSSRPEGLHLRQLTSFMCSADLQVCDQETTMAEVTQQQVVEYIKGISVLELSQLVKTLETELGVSAAVPMAMPQGGMSAGGAAAPVEEKTEF